MDESRKQFEEWFMDDVVGAAVDFPEFEDGEYVAGEVYDEQLYVMLQAMYMAWTASRAAIEIDDENLKIELENLECAQICLDEAGVPRKEGSEELSLWGRIVRYAAGIKVKE